LQIVSTNSSATEKLAEQIGHNLSGGEVIELVSDLGGGKTTFVRGLARGMGSPEHVSSPTFTVSKAYKAKELMLHHFDFYRLPEAGLIGHELGEVLGEDENVIVVEWAGMVQHVLPEERLTVHIKNTGEETREFVISYPKSLSYLVENL